MTTGAAARRRLLRPGRHRPLGAVIRALRSAGLGARPEPPPTPDPATEPGATFDTATHSGPAGARDYRLYRPAALAGRAPRGLVLMLHGCRQTPEDFAVGTGMNRLGEAHGLLIAYPAQPRADNSNGCWNWYRREHQGRGSGEPAILAELVMSVAADNGVPEDRIFVAGLSAGGAMAVLLAMAYPEVFAAIGVHSGVPHGSAAGAFTALSAMRGDPVPGPDPVGVPVPMIVFHGDADKVVHPANAVRLASAGRESGAPRAIRGTAGGRRFSRWVVRGNDAAAPLEYWLVEGGGHAWLGGDPAGSFADPAGPDASAEMVRFFLAHAGRRRAPSAQPKASPKP